MKFSLNLEKLSQANVWLHDLPAAGFEGEEITETFLSAATIAQVRRAALELFVPVGGRIIYGLLGGILIPANPEVLDSRPVGHFARLRIAVAGLEKEEEKQKRLRSLVDRPKILKDVGSW